MMPTMGRSSSTVTQASDFTGLRFSDNTTTMMLTVVRAYSANMILRTHSQSKLCAKLSNTPQDRKKRRNARPA